MAAYIYQDDNYRGTSASLQYGDYYSVRNTTGLSNDSITSVRVKPFTRVILYDDAYYSGRSLVVDGPKDIPNLKNYAGDMNDTISSIRVIRMEPSLNAKVNCCTGVSGGNCGEFVPGSARCSSVMAEYCSNPTNIGTNICKTWCRDNTTVCDSAVIAWCASHPSDPYCTCINSKATGINPTCVDKACIETGYATTNMKTIKCPDQINCTVKNELYNNGVSVFTQIPIEQDCGGGSPTGNTANDSVSTGAGIGGLLEGVQNWATALMPNTLLLIVFIMFVFIAIYLAITGFMGEKAGAWSRVTIRE